MQFLTFLNCQKRICVQYTAAAALPTRRRLSSVPAPRLQRLPPPPRPLLLPAISLTMCFSGKRWKQGHTHSLLTALLVTAANLFSRAGFFSCSPQIKVIQVFGFLKWWFKLKDKHFAPCFIVDYIAHKISINTIVILFLPILTLRERPLMMSQF